MKESASGVLIKRSRVGLGLFATKVFKRGDCIIEYTGEHISNKEADRRSGKYLFVLSKDVTIDARSRHNTARYINHSCKPNAEAEIDEDAEKVHINARKKILPGEEITYDYGKEYWEWHIKRFGCKCSACASVINEKVS